MGFSRQEYWSGLPFPSPGDPPDPGIEPRSPALEADAGGSEDKASACNAGEEMTTHSSTLALKNPWMEEPSRLQSMGSQRVGRD